MMERRKEKNARDVHIVYKVKGGRGGEEEEGESEKLWGERESNGRGRKKRNAIEHPRQAKIDKSVAVCCFFF